MKTKYQQKITIGFRLIYTFSMNWNRRKCLLFTYISFVTVFVTVYWYQDEKQGFPEFGRPMRELFYLDKDYVQMNHGSFGVYPKVVYQILRDYQDRSNKNSILWYKRDVITELARIRRFLGEYINANPDDIVVIPNTSSGLTAVLRSWRFLPGERILTVSTIYDAVDGIVKAIVNENQSKISTVVFNVTYPITNEEYMTKFETFLDSIQDSERPIRMALIDHITSSPATISPLDKMIPMLRKRNMTITVDGAHAYGQVPIDIAALDPDFYITDTHKWGFTSRSCAIMFVKKDYQGIVHPVTPSRFYSTPSNFQKEFYWTGTIDYSAYMTIPTALEFRQEVGGEKAIMNYIHNLAWQGGHRMAELLGTRILQSKEQVGGMVCVQLPVDSPNDPKLSGDWWLDAQVYRAPGTFSPVHMHNGQWWTRVSAQIYMDISDFELHAKHLLAICTDLNNKIYDNNDDSKIAIR